MSNRRKLTTTEKQINRLRRVLDKNPTYEHYVAWREALDSFVMTHEGAALYEETAKEVLEKARFFPDEIIFMSRAAEENVLLKHGIHYFVGSPKVFRDGYDHAVACLYNAHLLKRIVAARERANMDVLPGMELTSRS